MHKVGDAETDDTIVHRQDTDGNVQAIGERLDCLETAVTIAVAEHLDGIVSRRTDRRGVRIFGRIGDPQLATGVEGHVERLGDLRL